MPNSSNLSSLDAEYLLPARGQRRMLPTSKVDVQIKRHERNVEYRRYGPRCSQVYSYPHICYGHMLAAIKTDQETFRRVG